MLKILVTGANGQLGSELKEISQLFKQFHFDFTDVDTLDIVDLKQLEAYFDANKPDYIINCVAYTNVDKAESDKQTALMINSQAVENLAIMAQKCKSGFIHISTDYVFDSVLQNVPFNENIKPSATSVYGFTKLLGEESAKKAFKHLIIRTSWLYSSYGHNFVKTILRLGKERNELGIVFDQVGTPCYARDLAHAILKMIEQVEHSGHFESGIYHYSNEGVCSWYDFAVEILKIAQIKCIVKPIESKDYPLPAKRPAFSVLNKSKIKQAFGLSIPHWTDALSRCMRIINEQK